MLASWSFSAVSAILLLITRAEAQRKPFITTYADVITECKTCPRSLCPNVATYSDGDGLAPFNVTCWTRGTKIVGDNLWLKTDKGCYVTQYDVQEYDGDYTEALAYCGRQSEEQDLTIVDAKIKWKAECRISLGAYSETIAWLREDTDLELTCWTGGGPVVIDDGTWFKTTNNCYVPQKHLYSKPDVTYLDHCGPVPSLEWSTHHPENSTTDVNKRAAKAEPVPELEDRGKMLLVNLTVGEEYAYCRSCPAESCRSQKTYEFDQEVWAQCLIWGSQNASQVWTQTTDFCYMKSEDFWEPPESNVRFPGCDLFTDGGPSRDDDEDE